MSNSQAPLLAIKELNINYGGIHALKNASLSLVEGEILSIIGANGAGKSSLLNSIIGIVKARSGQIIYDQKDITKSLPHTRSRMGITLVPEGRRLFSRLTVEENLKCGHYQHKPADFAAVQEKIYSIFPVLADRSDELTGRLSGGEQQMVAIGRALASRPRLMMLDEPSMGLAPIIVKKIFSALHRIAQEEKITIILVEQNVRLALNFSQRAIILETGKIKMTGSSKSMLDDPKVKSAYLGKSFEV